MTTSGVVLDQSDALVTGNTFGGQSAGVSIDGGAPTISGNTFEFEQDRDPRYVRPARP